ncbi:chloride channel protein [uncultured Mesonia sp.]|uniref:chloride channel protein n=1 Tax=uncultured Mesonia sp. TaxID=399731 RepID=UPI00374EACB1
MPSNKKFFKRFLKWRYKNISDKNFINFLAILIGLAAGFSAVILKNLTHFISAIFEDGVVASYHRYWYFIFPLIGLLLTFLVKKIVIKTKVAHGIPMALFAMSKKEGKVNRSNLFTSLITAPLTVGFGGSVGLEGPSVATGAAFGSGISDLFHMKAQTRKLLLVCAAAGSLSAIFKAPIAAILFALEVFSLELTFTSMLPLLIASVSAVLTRLLLIGEQYIVNLNEIQNFEISNLLFYIFLGLFAGMVSIYFTMVYFKTENQFRKVQKPIFRVILAGIILGVLTYLVPPLYGEGFEFMNNIISQDYETALDSFLFPDQQSTWVVLSLMAGLIFLKPLATAVTLSGGGVGGVFAPVLFLGTVLGSFYVNFCKQLGFILPSNNFAMLGMAGLMAGVLQAPLTAMFLIAEVTGGYQLFIPLMLVVGTAFMISKSYQESNIYTKELKEKNALLTLDKDQSVLTLLNLDSIIETNFIILKPGMTLKDMLFKAVVKSKRNLYPVVDEDEKLIGVITLDDIRDIMFDQDKYESVLVEFLMHDPPDFIDYEQDHMQQIMLKFQNSAAWNLPVLKQGKYVGFVSKSKLLTAYRRKLITY